MAAKNIFKNAKVGDIFVCHDGHIAIYLNFCHNRHELICIGNDKIINCTSDGVCGIITNDYDIVAKWNDYYLTVKPYQYRPDIIVDAVCSVFRINIDDMRKKIRKREIAYPRQAMCYYLGTLTTLNSTQIGGIVDKDRATVLYHIHSWNNQLRYPVYKSLDKQVLTYLSSVN